MFPEGRILDFAIVGVIALIVVGPKDLPILMRKAGQYVARMRAMAAEFRASFDEMARQSELDELRREVEAMRTGKTLTGKMLTSAVGLGPDEQGGQVLDDIRHTLATPILDAPTATPALASPTLATTPLESPNLDASDEQPDLPFGDRIAGAPMEATPPPRDSEDAALSGKAAS